MFFFLIFDALWTGDVLIQISETQRSLTVEMDGVVSMCSLRE